MIKLRATTAMTFCLLIAGGFVLSACGSGGAPSTTSNAGDQTVAPLPSTTKKVVGYYRFTSVDPATLPAEKLDYLIFAFVDISTTDHCLPRDAADVQIYAKLQQLKQRNANLKILFSIGGPNRATEFSNVAASAVTREQFARDCVQFMQQYGFDGIDIDWEFPSTAADKANFTRLLAALRDALDTSGTHHELTIAASAVDYSAYYELHLIHPYLDWINLMSYDFSGAWSAQTGFNAPLNNWSGTYRARANIEYAVNDYLNLGVPPEKILLGVPFYGQLWSNVTDVNNGLQQSFDRTTSKAVTYNNIKNTYLNDLAYVRYWHNLAHAPWLYNPSTGVMISYDDASSICAKAEYAENKHLGGAFVWELTQDATGTLINVLHKRLRNPATISCGS